MDEPNESNPEHKKTESGTTSPKNSMDSRSLSLFAILSFLVVSIPIFFIFVSFDADRLGAAVISMTSGFFVVYMVMRANGIKLDYKFKGFGIETELKEGIKNVQTEVRSAKKDFNDQMKIITNSITNLNNKISFEGQINSSQKQNVDLGSVGDAVIKSLEFSEKLLGLESIEKSAQRYQERKQKRKKNGMQKVHLTNKLDLASRAICRILVKNESGNTVGFAVGFLVSPQLLLTANHVLGSVVESKRSLAEFNFEDDYSDNLKPVEVFHLEPERFYYTNRDLDFTLVAVRNTSNSGLPLSGFGYLKLNGYSDEALVRQHVSIIDKFIQRTKSIDLNLCEVIDIFDNFITYKGDMERGLGGSPVFNDVWEVVAIHHSRIPKTDENGNWIATDGQIWSASSEFPVAWIAFEGIRINKILVDLKSQSKSWADEKRELVEDIIKFA